MSRNKIGAFPCFNRRILLSFSTFAHKSYNFTGGDAEIDTGDVQGWGSGRLWFQDKDFTVWACDLYLALSNSKLLSGIFERNSFMAAFIVKNKKK